ncbi:hypothetical protein DN745_09610 [Bradymonas sediminis]|uniref:OmpA-like domain-containing protein n=2 Tax=Bradymonas sediminis TaxID=1548548 RepID=A0A2Z4FLL1_9DELT|nr:hypothetical protein DN745_09610 [Bradymonas sediminis]
MWIGVELMLKQNSLRFLIISMLSLGLGLSLVSGCSTPPKPKELTELERILQAPDALEVRDAPGTEKYYREARQYRRVSRKAYEDNDVERAKEYALLGTLRYRTAAAIKKQSEDKARLDEANALVAAVNPEIQTLSEERNKLVKEVAALEMQVARARNAREQAKRMQQAQSNNSFQRNTADSTGAMAAIGYKFDAANEAREKALTVKADEFAIEEFNAATTRYNAAVVLRSKDSSSALEVGRAADEATALYGKAYAVAKPLHEESIAMQNPDARRAAIRTDAQSTFGAPFTVVEPLGVRVVLAMSFDKGSWTLNADGQVLAASAAKLADKYKEAELIIEGYTRKGDPTENLGVSASRARTVRKVFTDAGVKDSRITTSGLGQENPRFGDDASKNDRIEVIFRIP